LSVSRFRPAQRPPRIQVASPLARERGGWGSVQCNWLRKSCELAIGVRTPHLHPLPFFKRRGGPPTAPTDNQRTLPNQRSHGCAIARRRDARTGLGSARVPGAGCGVPHQRNSPEPLFPCKVISPKKSSRTPGDVRQHARGVRSPETWRDAH